MAVNALSIRPVHADRWVVVATDASLTVGIATQLLIETLWSSGIDHAELTVGAGRGRLKVYLKGDTAAPVDTQGVKELLLFDVADRRLRLNGEALFLPQFKQQLGIRG